MNEFEESAPVRLPAKIYDRIESEVVNLYVKLNIHKVPIDAFQIAAQLGIVVKKYSELPFEAKFALEINDNEGCSHYHPELGAFIIYYDDNESRLRTRFTLMHEIGHIQLGHLQESYLANKMANYFAGYALAPSPLILHFKCDDFLDVADKFDISGECADCCFNRYNNWMWFGKHKEYETKLLNLFQ